MNSIGIYIHVPYCRTLCPYCDFVKLRTSGDAPDAYVEALCREIDAFEARRTVGSIFFGGGTPSLLSSVGLGRIMERLAHCFDMDQPEITLEANPDDVTEALVASWSGAGVTRISLGVQSFDASCLRYLGRRHDDAGARRACAIVGERFENWSLDLIFGAPPTEAWPRTVEEARAIAPPHLSAYGLTYEPGTPFERRADEAVDDETSLAMYNYLRDALEGYDHYEISNFARPGRRCAHNLIYWHNGEYAGFGPGAYSFIDGVRSRNVADVAAYLDAPGHRSEALHLDECEVRIETLIQHLRLRDGIAEATYAARFGRDLRRDFGPQLDRLMERGLVTHAEGRYWPTRLGFDLNNEIGLALVS